MPKSRAIPNRKFIPDIEAESNIMEDQGDPRISRLNAIRADMRAAAATVTQEDIAVLDATFNRIECHAAARSELDAFIVEEEQKHAWEAKNNPFSLADEVATAHLSAEGEAQYTAEQEAELAWRDHNVPAADHTRAEINFWDKELASEAIVIEREVPAKPAALGGGQRERQFARDGVHKDWRDRKALKKNIVQKVMQQLEFDHGVATGTIHIDPSLLSEQQHADLEVRAARLANRHDSMGAAFNAFDSARISVVGPRVEGRFCKLQMDWKDARGHTAHLVVASANSLEGLVSHLNDTFLDPAFAVGNHKSLSLAAPASSADEAENRKDKWVNRAPQKGVQPADIAATKGKITSGKGGATVGRDMGEVVIPVPGVLGFTR